VDKNFRITILIIVLTGILFGDGNNKGKRKKYKISIGINYSNFYTVDSHSSKGFNIGVYKKINQFNGANLELGLNLTKNNIILKNKLVRPDSFSGDEIIYFSDSINITYNNILCNLILNKPLLSYKNLSLSFLFGAGFSLYLSDDTEVDIKYKKEYDDPENKYDYYYANEAYFLFLSNSGFIVQTGVSISWFRYILDTYYSIHLHNFGINGNHLVLEERMQRINIDFGIEF